MDYSNLTSFDFDFDFESIDINEFCLNISKDQNELCKKISQMIFLLKIDHYIDKVFYPLTILLVIIGTILNLYCLFYFLQIQRRNSQNIYLSALSITDTIDLHLNITLPIFRQLSTFDEYFRHSFKLCRFIGVLNEFFQIFPTWILVLITIERLKHLLQSVKTSLTYAKRSLIFLSILVTLLSLYRLVDLKGIDQISIFSVVACSGSHRSLMIIRNFNLITWILVPNCSTLIMCFLIIYSNKCKIHKNHCHPHRTTKIVLFLSILTLICHTPIGILHGLDMVYSHHEENYIFLTIILVRKSSFILYQISLCCKFLIYNKIFGDFKKIFNRSISRLSHRSNSAELGKQFLDYLQDNSSNHRRISFGTSTKSNLHLERRENSLKYHGRRQMSICNQGHHQQMNYINRQHRLISC